MKTIRHRLLTTSAVVVTLLTVSPPVRGQAPGSLDALDADVVGNYLQATAVQPDGKTIIAGQFTSVLGVPRSNIARLNADGSLDPGFDPKANAQVNSVAVQADGKILLGGSFTTLQPNGAATPTTRYRIARVNVDGSLDPDFDPKANSTVFSMAAQADGKIVLGGLFTMLQPNGAASAITRQYVARVNDDGGLDPGFDPKPDGFVRSVAVQADGRILLGGDFGTLQPTGAASATARQCIARVNYDGSLDPGFDPKANSGVSSVAVEADGKILLGGVFTTLQPNGAASATPRTNIARVNADGTLDPDFNPKANGRVISMAVQADGKILLGGSFTTLQPNGAVSTTARSRIARLNTDGSLDTGFDPKAENDVLTVAVQADGKILLGGFFTTLQPNGAVSTTARKFFARLNNDAAIQTLSAPDATQVQWQRGGASPELSLVTFETSIDGGANWTAPGNGTRVGTTANWQLTGLALPNSGQLRARGHTTNGYVNGGSGLVETVVSFGPGIAVEQPLGTGLVDGTNSVAFGTVTIGSSSATKTFTIMNSGIADLSGLAISKDGANPGDFTVSAPGNTTVTPGNSTTFTVTFTPGGTASAMRTAAIHIASNVSGSRSPFDIALTGQALSFTNDTDGDGLNDASEFQMAALGFDWQVSQPALVNTYYATAIGAGLYNQAQFDANRTAGRNDVITAPNTYSLYTLAQVQALNVDVPLLTKNAGGQFKLTIGVQKTTSTSQPFIAFPMSAPQTTINAQGQLEFLFTVPENAAFFRVQAQ